MNSLALRGVGHRGITQPLTQPSPGRSIPHVATFFGGERAYAPPSPPQTELAPSAGCERIGAPTIRKTPAQNSLPESDGSLSVRVPILRKLAIRTVPSA